MQPTTVFEREREGEQVKGLTVALVAVINPGIDWAAYQNGYDHTLITYDQVARNGDKVPEEVARFFFPNVAERYRR